MSAPEVTWTLDKIKTNWSAGSYSDIPLERIDRDDSDKLDGNVRSHVSDLQADNYVGATFADRSTSPIGTEFDYDVEAVVGVRIEGLHHTEYGYVDPDASLPPSTAGDPVPWDALVEEIRSAIMTDRKHPSVGRSNVSYTDVQIANENRQSANFGDYYRCDFDLLFNGYEEL